MKMTLQKDFYSEIFSSLETKKVRKIPNETFLRITRYIFIITGWFACTWSVSSCEKGTSTALLAYERDEGELPRSLD